MSFDIILQRTSLSELPGNGSVRGGLYRRRGVAYSEKNHRTKLTQFLARLRSLLNIRVLERKWVGETEDGKGEGERGKGGGAGGRE